MKTDWTPGQWKHYYTRQRHDQLMQRAQDTLNAKIEALSAPRCANPSKGWTDEEMAAHNAHVLAVLRLRRMTQTLNRAVWDSRTGRNGGELSRRVQKRRRNKGLRIARNLT